LSDYMYALPKTVIPAGIAGMTLLLKHVFNQEKLSVIKVRLR